MNLVMEVREVNRLYIILLHHNWNYQLVLFANLGKQKEKLGK